MSIKDGVLQSLERNRGKFISGEELARAAGVSRQAVFKAVKSLKNDGHIIVSSTKKGYLLESGSDVISASVINAMTGARTYVFDRVSSTNAVAEKFYAEVGECLVIALAQTGGRKKDGGEFFSPENKGIYLTLALPLETEIGNLKRLRAICGETVADVITSSCGKKAVARNLDDVYIGDKKVCGILIECAVNAASERTTCAFIGIGIYTTEECFDDTSLSSVFPDESRNKMIADIYLILKEKLPKIA